LRYRLIPRELQFRFEAGTSRGVLTHKTTYFLKVWEEGWEEAVGWGECAPLQGLSPDYGPEFPARASALLGLAEQLGNPWEALALPALQALPSLAMGLETALHDWQSGGRRVVFSEPFAQGQVALPINGLVWMGSREFMLEQIGQKLEAGFSCLKMKIGAIDFEAECGLLAHIRRQFGPEELTLRVDANGAFAPEEAMEKLGRLEKYALHSIEQPIKAGQWEQMARLCERSPVPIALDEELIGVPEALQEALLEDISPQYIILKPTLLGGFRASDRWIGLAEQRGIGWWMTSALEANIGLNAIAQFTAMKGCTLPQGLGTGQLFHNNVPSPLEVAGGFLRSRLEWGWELPA
jgi:o-succinylbenzoate synthase